MNDDVDLLRTYAATGIEAAFTAFVDRHFNLVYSAAVRQVAGDAEAARDIAQQVFVDVARKARFLAGHPALAGWLYTSTYYTAAKFRRTEARRRRREEAAAAMHDLTSPSTDWSALQPHLDAAMHRLAKSDREAILLRFFQQQPFGAIAQRLGINETAAQMRVRRALDKLRAALAREGVTSTAAALGLTLSHQAVLAAPVGLSAAIASAAAGPAATAGLGFVAFAWNFMITSKTVLTSACFLGLLAVGSGIYSTVRLQSAIASAREADRQRREWVARATAAEKRERTALAKLGRTTPAEIDEPISGVLSATKPDLMSLVDRAVGREITENPELRRALGERERAKFRLDHASLFRQFALTPEQIDVLVQAKIRSESEKLDYTVAAAELNHTEFTEIARDPKASAALAHKQQEIDARREQAFRQVLGDAAYATFHEHERTQDARALANEVSKATLFTDAPISADQRESLVRSIAQHSADGQGGQALDLGRVNWSAVFQDMNGRLSPAQLEQLRARQPQPSGVSATDIKP